MQTWSNKRGITLSVLACCLMMAGCASGPASRNTAVQQPAADAAQKVASIYAGSTTSAPALEQAAARWQAQVSANPKDAQAQLNLGVLLRSLEKFNEALQAFEAASQLLEDPVIATNEIGILQRTQGEFAQAEKTYRQILVQRPGFHDAHFNLGILYDLYLRRPVDAQTHYQAYIANAPDADARVEKWLADLVRRHKLDAGATAVMNNE